MKILAEKTENVLNNYEEEAIKEIMDKLRVAQGMFGDSGLRCIYLLQAEQLLRGLIANIADSYI